MNCLHMHVLYKYNDKDNVNEKIKIKKHSPNSFPLVLCQHSVICLKWLTSHKKPL